MYIYVCVCVGQLDAEIDAVLKKNRGPSGPRPTNKPEVAVFSGSGAAKTECPKKLDFIEAFNSAQSATLIPRRGEGAASGLSTLTLFGVSERTLLYSHACPLGNVEKNAISADAMQMRTRDFAELFLTGEAIGAPVPGGGGGGGGGSSIAMEDIDDDEIVEFFCFIDRSDARSAHAGAPHPPPSLPPSPPKTKKEEDNQEKNK